MNHVTALPGAPSPWVLLLDGLGRTAVGMGLLLGRAAAVVEHRSSAATLPQPGGRAAIAVLRPLAELDKAVA